MYFPTVNTPSWIFILVSNDGSTWTPTAPSQYTGNGNEIYTWNFSADFTSKATFWRLVIASASNTSFDLGGVQFFNNPGVGLGNALYSCNLTGTNLTFNNNPFPIIPLVVLSDEGTAISTSTVITFRCPTTFRITPNKLPIFALTYAHANGNITLDILLNGSSIYYGAAGYGNKATIGQSSNTSGSLYSTSSNSSSCGLLGRASFSLSEGDTIQAKVLTITGTPITAKGLKVTFYSS